MKLKFIFLKFEIFYSVWRSTIRYVSDFFQSIHLRPFCLFSGTLLVVLLHQVYTATFSTCLCMITCCQGWCHLMWHGNVNNEISKCHPVNIYKKKTKKKQKKNKKHIRRIFWDILPTINTKFEIQPGTITFIYKLKITFKICTSWDYVTNFY